MANQYHDEAKRLRTAKVERIVGHTKNYIYPTDKADRRYTVDKTNTFKNGDNSAYYENDRLDPLPSSPRTKAKS